MDRRRLIFLYNNPCISSTFAHMQDFVPQLVKYVPEKAAPIISAWINKYACQFRVTRSRMSKFGDYRPPQSGHGHRISVNHDLNPYAFLITAVHEFAHLETHLTHKGRVKPHGEEWKKNFKQMMDPFFQLDIFPPDIHSAIDRYIQNPKASSCTDHHLFRTLQRYNPEQRTSITVEELPVNTVFGIRNGRQFRKEKKLRTRYYCTEIGSGRAYLFSPLTPVVLLTATDVTA